MIVYYIIVNPGARRKLGTGGKAQNRLCKTGQKCYNYLLNLQRKGLQFSGKEEAG